MNIKLTFQKEFKIEVDKGMNFLKLYYQNTDSDTDFLSIENFDEFQKDTMGDPSEKEDARNALISLNGIVAKLKRDGYIIDDEYEWFEMLTTKQ